MSTTHEAPAGSTPGDEDVFPEPAAAQAASGTKAWVERNRLPLIAVVAVVGVLAGTAAAWVSTRPAGPVTASTPVALPARTNGLDVLANDPLRGAGWREKAGRAIGPVAWSARSYGTGGTGKTVRVVAARTDLTGKLEQAWAVGTGTQVGTVTCTHNTRLTPSSTARVRPTLLLCWRTSASLSSYALVIDPKARTAVPDAEGASAVETAWRSAGGSD